MGQVCSFSVCLTKTPLSLEQDSKEVVLDHSLVDQIEKTFKKEYGSLLNKHKDEMIVEDKLLKKKLKWDPEVKSMKFQKPIKPLYWAINVQDLKESVQIFKYLGAKVLKHEEFESENTNMDELSYLGPYHEF